MDIIKALADLDEKIEPHMARVLLLLRAFGGETGFKPFDGLTKLAKLDFLLRYPYYLEQALNQVKKTKEKLAHDYERRSIESKMIRYRYGPWDPRHRKVINLLIGKGLIEAVEGKPTLIKLTMKGAETANILRIRDTFSDIVSRVMILSKHFDWSGTKLKKFIYSTFPEILSLEYGEPIEYEY